MVGKRTLPFGGTAWRGWSALLILIVSIPTFAAPAPDEMEAWKAALAGGAKVAENKAPIALSSAFIEVAVGDNGNFTVGTLEGDPGNPLDDNKNILFGHPIPGTGATTLRVDGTDYWNYGSGQQIGQITSPPSTVDGVNTTIWQVDDISLTQRLRIVQGDSGRLDTLSIEYAIHNSGAVSHNVGVRSFFDTQLGDNDGAPFRVPGLGDVTFERELLGDVVPQSYQSFDDLANPAVQTQGTLIGGMAVRPDRVVWGNWSHLNDAPFDFTVDPNIDLSDSAVAVYWNPVAIGPGGSRTVGTYYGLGDIHSVQGDLIVGLSGPGELSVVEGAYVPNPFTVTAFISTPAAAAGSGNITAQLELPAGLELAQGQTSSHDVGDLPPNQTTQTSWQVLATGTPSGELVYSVHVTRNGIQPVDAMRSILVPHVGEVSGIPLHAGFEEGVFIGSGLVQSSIGLGDIDQDGLDEIVVGGSDGTLYGYNGDGTPVVPGGLHPGSLFDTPDGAPILSTPTMADVDLDRRVDVFFGTDGGEIYRLELKLTSDAANKITNNLTLGANHLLQKRLIKARPAKGEEDDAGR